MNPDKAGYQPLGAGTLTVTRSSNGEIKVIVRMPDGSWVRAEVEPAEFAMAITGMAEVPCNVFARRPPQRKPVSK